MISLNTSVLVIYFLGKREEQNSLTSVQQLDHRPSHSLADVHVSLGISTVVAAGTPSFRKRVGVYGGDVALELRILT